MLSRICGRLNALRTFRPNVPKVQIGTKVAADTANSKKQSIYRKSIKIAKSYGLPFIILRVVINCYSLVILLKVFIDHLHIEESDSIRNIMTWILGEERNGI